MQKFVRSNWDKISVVVAVLASLALDSAAILAQEAGNRQTVAEVRIIGNQNISTDQILDYVHIRAGMDFDKSMIYDDVNRALASKQFKDIRVEIRKSGDGMQVTYVICEWPSKVLEVIYRNAKHISQKDLECMMPAVYKGAPMNPAANKKACQAIQEALKNRGRFWANVTLEQGDKATDTRVIFNISEGPIVRVRSQQVVDGGTVVLGGRCLRQENLSRCVMCGNFETMFNEQAKKLQECLASKGCPARVTYEMKFSDDYSEVDVVFHVQADKSTDVDNSNPNCPHKDSMPESSNRSLGNDVTQERVIIRMQNLYPALNIGEATLIRSNLFDVKDEFTKPTAKAPDSKDNNNDNSGGTAVLVPANETAPKLVAVNNEVNEVQSIYIIGGLVIQRPANQGDVVSEIVIKGNKHVTNEQIMKCLGVSKGQPFDQNGIEKAVKRLLETKLIQDASVNSTSVNGSVTVTVQIVEVPFVEEIAFDNSFSIDDNDLLKLVRCYGLARNMKVDAEANRRACEAIQAEFVARGYFWATVAVKEDGRNADGRVVFDVKEGPLVHIRSISFAGNDSISADQLRSRVDDKMTLQGCAGIYRPRLADELAHELEQHYTGTGYCEAKVQHVAKFNHGNESADLLFKVVEGQHYKVNDWHVETPKALQVPADLKRAITLKRGEFFDESLARNDAGAITECYRKLGWPVTVTVDLTYPKPGFVQVNYTVTRRQADVTNSRPNSSSNKDNGNAVPASDSQRSGPNKIDTMPNRSRDDMGSNGGGFGPQR